MRYSDKFTLTFDFDLSLKTEFKNADHILIFL